MKVFIGKYPKNPNKERKVKIQIDPWDTWSMDDTLALIITPMLKQLQLVQHGAPNVELVDVPEHLHSERLDDNDVDTAYFDRWQYVLNEMIFAFESKHNDWEEQFWKVKPEIDFSEHPEDKGEKFTELRWKVQGECDWDARKAYDERIQNGFRLFGKYYQGLWD